MKDVFKILVLVFIAVAMATPTMVLAKNNKPKFAKSKRFRTIDGSFNNRRNPDWGKANIELIRITDLNYGDGVAQIAGTGKAGPREISNALSAQDESIFNDRDLTDFVWQWGQFLDHDIDLTVGMDPVEAEPIAIPTGDPFFDPKSTGTQVIPFTRSAFFTDENTTASTVRQQMNSITSFIDASNVYGSDEVRAAALRAFEGGKLKTSLGNLLPFNTEGLPNAGGDNNSKLYLAGDVRANESSGLLSMHVLFVREHNRKAAEIAQANPKLNDEQIYQKARRYVGALMQVITYNEFLPALLGEDAIAPYRGYKKKVDASIANSFSTAAYRFGHSAVAPTLLRLDNDGNVIPEGNLPLRDAFFRPDRINSEDDIGHLMKGLASQRMQEVDLKIVDDLRNFLFGAPGSGGMDLAALNIQRGRDHGLANYNQMRRDYGLDPITSFSEISSDAEVNEAIKKLCNGDIEAVDAWTGVLAEDHVPGSSAGELMLTALKRQFEALRDGDRLWYQRIFKGKRLQELENTRLSDIIKRNTQISNIQDDVFRI